MSWQRDYNNIQRALDTREAKRRHPHSPVPAEEKHIDQTLEQLRINEDTDYLEGAQVLTIGNKYRGRTFEWIAERDKHYVDWVLQCKYPKGSLGDFRKWLVKNRKRLLQRQVDDALKANGPLSKRVHAWPKEELKDRGILRALPSVNVAKKEGLPRTPVYSLQASGVLPEWDARWTKREKQAEKTKMSLCDRAMSYLFRRLVHELRGAEPVVEKLVADSALLVLRTNHKASEVARALAKGDPDVEVELAKVEASLQAKRAKIRNPKKRALLPKTFNFARLRNQERATSREILLRFKLSVRELEAALRTYRDLRGNPDSLTADVLRACWIMARADGAFDYDRVANHAVPEKLLDPELQIYEYIARFVRRHFVTAPSVTYAPCSTFTRNCPLEADLVVGDTVYSVRSKLWISSTFDGSYLQGYAAIAREAGIPINHMVCVYPQHGTHVGVDISDWDHTPLLAFLREDASRNNSACDVGLCASNVPTVLMQDSEEESAAQLKRAQKRQAAVVRRRGAQAGVRVARRAS